MFLTKEQVMHAMQLTPVEVMQAQAAAGYTPDRVYAVRFLGMSVRGSFCYEIDCKDTINGDGTCRTYVKYYRECGDNVVLRTEF
jgi:hypothetical protein